MKPISIAIDGPSGAGKSTIARKSAEKFGRYRRYLPHGRSRGVPARHRLQRQRRGHCHAAGAAH